jgi:hypothetical protein
MKNAKIGYDRERTRKFSLIVSLIVGQVASISAPLANLPATVYYHHESDQKPDRTK